MSKHAPTKSRSRSKVRHPEKASRLGKRAATEAAARAGKLPPPPNFKARTHERWRPMLREVVALAKAGGLEALKGYEINAYSTSPKAISRYRDLAVLALSARSSSS